LYTDPHRDVPIGELHLLRGLIPPLASAFVDLVTVLWEFMAALTGTSSLDELCAVPSVCFVAMMLIVIAPESDICALLLRYSSSSISGYAYVIDILVYNAGGVSCTDAAGRFRTVYNLSHIKEMPRCCL
jgi:hypothetical protein